LYIIIESSYIHGIAEYICKKSETFNVEDVLTSTFSLVKWLWGGTSEEEGIYT
jgi:hypothetical protein